MKPFIFFRHPALAFWAVALVAMLSVGVWAYRSGEPSPSVPPVVSIDQVAQWRAEALGLGNAPDVAARAQVLAANAAEFSEAAAGAQRDAWLAAQAAALKVAAEPADQEALTQLAAAADEIVVALPLVQR